MTSEAKAGISPDTSGLVDGLPAIAASVTTPLNDIATYVEDKARQYVSVSAADANVKHLDNALGVTGAITKTIINPGGDEQLRLAVDNTAASWNASQIQGRNVASTAPTEDQVLAWNGSAWAPADAANDDGNATSIQGNPVDSGTPETGQTYVWDGNSFALVNVDKSVAQWNANKFQGNAVDTGVPSSGQTYVWDGDSFALVNVDKALAQWNASHLRGHLLDSDPLDVGQGYVWDGTKLARVNLNKEAAQWNANKFQGRNVSDTAPEVGQILTWNGTAWVPGSPGTPSNPNGIADGRLTLTSGVPVTTGDIAGADTIYYTPHVGNRIALYNGTTWIIHTFSEISLALTLAYAAGTNHDIFIFNNSGVLTLGASTWTNNTTRAVALARQDGVLVMSGSPGSRYLGTIRIAGADGECEDSVQRRFVWNYYNRIPKKLYSANLNEDEREDATNEEFYSGSDYRLETVTGVAEDFTEVTVSSWPGAIAATGQIYLFAKVNGTGSADVPDYAITQKGAFLKSSVSAALSVGYNYFTSFFQSTGTGTFVMTENYQLGMFRC